MEDDLCRGFWFLITTPVCFTATLWGERQRAAHLIINLQRHSSSSVSTLSSSLLLRLCFFFFSSSWSRVHHLISGDLDLSWRECRQDCLCRGLPLWSLPTHHWNNNNNELSILVLLGFVTWNVDFLLKAAEALSFFLMVECTGLFIPLQTKKSCCPHWVITQALQSSVMNWHCFLRLCPVVQAHSLDFLLYVSWFGAGTQPLTGECWHKMPRSEVAVVQFIISALTLEYLTRWAIEPSLIFLLASVFPHLFIVFLFFPHFLSHHSRRPFLLSLPHHFFISVFICSHNSAPPTNLLLPSRSTIASHYLFLSFTLHRLPRLLRLSFHTLPSPRVGSVYLPADN